MKKLIVLVMVCAFVTLTNAQDALFYAKVKKEEIPANLLTAIEHDFPEGSILELKALPVEIIDGHWFVDVERNVTGKNYDTYVIKMHTSNGEIDATYDANGSLIYTTERLKEVALPLPLRKTIGRDFPGWAVSDDKALITHYIDGKQNAHYFVNLTKDGNLERIVLDGSGNLLKSREKREMNKMDHAKMKHLDKKKMVN
ncbi:MAG: hypothetical protein R2828_07775 [Saprospiraceae bacterium]